MALNTTTDVDKIESVEDDAGNRVPARSDDYAHAGGTDADPSSTVAETLAVPARADRVTVLVQGADNSFTVELGFNNTTLTYSGDSTTDVDVTRDVVGDSLTVTISGNATTADYDIYVR